jgi:F-type H+-transporting ATPase subunit epsilon
MAETFSFKLVTPTGVIFEGPVRGVSAISPQGELGVLADHTNFITSLLPGMMRIRTEDGQSLEYLVTGGFIEVRDGVMTALALGAEPPEKVDPADDAELQAAEERLGHMSMFDADYDEARQRVMVLRARRRAATPKPTTH